MGILLIELKTKCTFVQFIFDYHFTMHHGSPENFLNVATRSLVFHNVISSCVFDPHFKHKYTQIALMKLISCETVAFSRIQHFVHDTNIIRMYNNNNKKRNMDSIFLHLSFRAILDAIE